MSGTRHEIQFITGCYDLLPNKALSDLLYAKMADVDDMTFSERETPVCARIAGDVSRRRRPARDLTG